jgi:hypothetical protein
MAHFRATRVGPLNRLQVRREGAIGILLRELLILSKLDIVVVL